MNQILYNLLLNKTHDERIEILISIYKSGGHNLFSSF